MRVHQEDLDTIFLVEDKFVDTFQVWLPRVEAEYGYSIKLLQVDGGGKFIFIKPQSFRKAQGIAIKYAAPYVYKENGFTVG